MWIPQELVIENLGSHKKTVYPFNLGATRLIQGENLDDTGQESNGSGKSIPLEAMRFCIDGTFFRKMDRVNSMISDWAEELIVSWRLSNAKLKMEIEIVRSLSHKSSQKVKIFVNGDEEKYSGVDSYNKRILELIGINKDDLFNYYLIHKDKFIPFISTGDGNKKKIISRFSGAHRIEGIDKDIEVNVKAIEETIADLRVNISNHEAKIEVYQEEIAKQSQEKFDQKKIERIQYLEVRNTQAEKEISEKRKEIVRTNDKIEAFLGEVEENEEKVEKLKKEKLNFEVVDYVSKIKTLTEEGNSYREVRNQFEEKVKGAKKDKSELEQFLAELDKQLAGIITCPSCSHEFLLGEDKDIKNLKKIKPQVVENIQEVQEDILDKQNDLQAISDEITSIREKIKIIEEEESIYKENIRLLENNITKSEKEGFIILNKSELAKKEIFFIERSIKSLQENIASNKKNILEVEKEIFEDNTKEYEDKVKEQQQCIKDIEKEIQKHEKEIGKHKEWMQNFVSFQSHLANKTLRSIEFLTNDYLKNMDSNISTAIEGYKMLADGKTIRENISVEILRNGMSSGEFGRYSSGEKIRIVLGNLLALQKLINLNSPSGGLDLTVLDEIIESVDATGVGNLIKTLNKLGQTIEIITHATNEVVGVDTLKIVKQNGESSISN